MKASVEIVKVNPKMAEQLLTSQVKEQRHLRDTWVKALAVDMENGNFRLSADALVVIKGALANGQHRLWAVIESNTTQPFLMMETDDDELYKVLDCGLRRTVGDAAHITNGNALSAIATLVLAYQQNLLTQYGFKKRIPRIEMIEFLQKNNDQLQSAYNFVTKLSGKTQHLAPKSVSSALMLITSHEFGDKATMFLEQVYSGSSPGTACHDLRERLIRMRMEKGTHPSQYYLALMIKSFNSFNQGTRVGSLRVTESECYPQIRTAKK